MSISTNKKILAIETSCDETGFCLLKADRKFPENNITITANELASQIEDHQEYGGVFPTLDKRLHAQNTPALLDKLLNQKETKAIDVSEKKKTQVREWLVRHPDLADALITRAEEGLPQLDAVAVTNGPGLEPALWVGLNIARSMGLFLDIPVIPINHMEGHVISAMAQETILSETTTLEPIELPAVALLASGGHTELIKINNWSEYEKIGQTRDDAAGEAFDKIGRMLGLPYPAGPHVSALAAEARQSESSLAPNHFPRPMLESNNLDFSFSGLKTAAARNIQAEDLDTKKTRRFARELEEAIVDVLVEKTRKAVRQIGAKDLLVGGGVSANKHLRSQLVEKLPEAKLHLAPLPLCGDNAVMIGLAALNHYEDGVDSASNTLKASSGLSL